MGGAILLMKWRGRPKPSIRSEATGRRIRETKMSDHLEPHGADGAAPVLNPSHRGVGAESPGANLAWAGGAGEAHRRMPTEDPMPNLPPAAARILAAAREVL